MHLADAGPFAAGLCGDAEADVARGCGEGRPLFLIGAGFNSGMVGGVVGFPGDSDPIDRWEAFRSSMSH